MIILPQNQSFYFINQNLVTHTAMDNTPTDPNNSALAGWTVYGLQSLAGNIQLFDSTGTSAFGSIAGGSGVPYSGIFQPVTYVSAAAETDAVVKYIENATALLPSTLYYFTLTQVVPSTTSGTQLITNTVYFTTDATPSTPTAGTVAAGLKASLLLLEGYHVVLTIATTNNTDDTLVITAAAGYPLLSAGGYDNQAASYGVTTPGVVSHGHPADMASRGFSTLPGYVSANNYDQLTVTFSAIDLSSGELFLYQSTVFINAAGTDNSAQKAFLGGATSFFAGYDQYYAIANTTFSSTTASKQ